MAREERGTEIEDIAEDAVNELLGMYGYEGVAKDELRASLKRGVSAGCTDHSKNPSRIACPAVRKGDSKVNQRQKINKITKPKTMSVTLLSGQNAAVQNSNMAQMCQWCRKAKAQIIENLPVAPQNSALSSNANGGKLKFCSPACTNAYKLNVFRRETEACLRSAFASDGPPDTSPSSDMSEPTKSPELDGTAGAKNITVSSQKSETSKPTVGNPQSSGSDLWQSAVGHNKKPGSKLATVSKSPERMVTKSRIFSDEDDNSKSATSTSVIQGHQHKQTRSKRRSAQPRPHPYYALNKKYWLTVKGNETTTSRRPSFAEESNETIGSETSAVSQKPQTPSNVVDMASQPLPLSEPVHMAAQSKIECCDSPPKCATPKQATPNQMSTTLPHAAAPEQTKNECCSVSPKANGHAPGATFSLANILSNTPLNVVWIPFPIPVPLPIPIPIPIPMDGFACAKGTKDS